MAKQKGNARDEANFISPLPIEECAHRLDRLSDKNIDIVILKMSSDTVDFKAQLLEKSRLRAEAKGALRRWEGTLTRVDVQVKVYEGVLRWILLVGAGLGVTMLLIPTLMLIAAEVNPMGWILIATGGIMVITGLMFLANRYAPYDDAPQDLLGLLEDTLS